MKTLQRLGITGYSLETAIQVGQMFVRGNELQNHLARYAQRFVNVTDDDVYQFQHLGTATGIRYRGRYFVISTEHQRKLGELGKLGIVCDPGQSVITPSKTWTLNLPEGSERDDNFDFAIYEFEPTAYPHRMLSSQFFEVGIDSGIVAPVGKIALNVGYPTRLQNIHYYEDEVDLLVAVNFVKLVEKTSSDNVFLFQTVNKDRFFEDGMSGSPVFELVRDSNGFRVKWLGVVIRGGKKSRHGRVICADFIINHINETIL